MTMIKMIVNVIIKQNKIAITLKLGPPGFAYPQIIPNDEKLNLP